MRIMEESGLQMMNKEAWCKGKWTWMQGEKRSIIDYVLGDDQVTPYITEMVILDEGTR